MAKVVNSLCKLIGINANGLKIIGNLGKLERCDLHNEIGKICISSVTEVLINDFLNGKVEKVIVKLIDLLVVEVVNGLAVLGLSGEDKVYKIANEGIDLLCVSISESSDDGKDLINEPAGKKLAHLRIQADRRLESHTHDPINIEGHGVAVYILTVEHTVNAYVAYALVDYSLDTVGNPLILDRTVEDLHLAVRCAADITVGINEEHKLCDVYLRNLTDKLPNDLITLKEGLVNEYGEILDGYCEAVNVCPCLKHIEIEGVAGESASLARGAYEVVTKSRIGLNLVLNVTVLTNLYGVACGSTGSLNILEELVAVLVKLGIVDLNLVLTYLTYVLVVTVRVTGRRNVLLKLEVAGIKVVDTALVKLLTASLAHTVINEVAKLLTVIGKLVTVNALLILGTGRCADIPLVYVNNVYKVGICKGFITICTPVSGITNSGTGGMDGLAHHVVTGSLDIIADYCEATNVTNLLLISVRSTAELRNFDIGAIGMSILGKILLIRIATSGALIDLPTCNRTGSSLRIGNNVVMSGCLLYLLVGNGASDAGVSYNAVCGTGNLGLVSDPEIMTESLNLVGDLLSLTTETGVKSITVGETGCDIGLTCAVNAVPVVTVKVTTLGGSHSGYGIVGEVLGLEGSVACTVDLGVNSLHGNETLTAEVPNYDLVGVITLLKRVGDLNGYLTAESTVTVLVKSTEGLTVHGCLKAEDSVGVVLNSVKDLLVDIVKDSGIVSGKLINGKLVCGKAYVTGEATLCIFVKGKLCITGLNLICILNGLRINLTYGEVNHGLGCSTACGSTVVSIAYGLALTCKSGCNGCPLMEVGFLTLLNGRIVISVIVVSLTALTGVGHSTCSHTGGSYGHSALENVVDIGLYVVYSFGAVLAGRGTVSLECTSGYLLNGLSPYIVKRLVTGLGITVGNLGVSHVTALTCTDEGSVTVLGTGCRYIGNCRAGEIVTKRRLNNGRARRANCIGSTGSGRILMSLCKLGGGNLVATARILTLYNGLTVYKTGKLYKLDGLIIVSACLNYVGTVAVITVLTLVKSISVGKTGNGNGLVLINVACKRKSLGSATATGRTGIGLATRNRTGGLNGGYSLNASGLGKSLNKEKLTAGAADIVIVADSVTGSSGRVLFRVCPIVSV